MDNIKKTNYNNNARKRIVICVLIIIFLLLFICLFKSCNKKDTGVKDTDIKENSIKDTVENKKRFEIKKIDNDNFELYIYGIKVENLGSNLKNGKLEVKELDDIIIVLEYRESYINRILAVNDDAKIVALFDYEIDNGNQILKSYIESYKIEDNILYIDVKRTNKNLKNNWYCFVDDSEILNYTVKYEYLGDGNFKDKAITNKKVLSAKYDKNDCYGQFAVDLDGGITNQVFLDKYEIDSLIELQIPTKDGYTFSGWQLIYGDSILNGNNVTFKGKQSLVKALWNPIKYKISFELNGGISNINNFDVLYDEIIEVENPTREGYKFTGWDITGDVNKKVAKHGTDKSYVENSINASVKSKYYKNLTNKLDGNIVFNATWVDDIEPIVETSLNTSTFTNSSVILNYTFKDAGSGIKEYSIDNTNNSVNWITLDESQKEITGTYSITENGIYYLNIKDTDGNISKKEIEISNIDKKAPVISFDKNGGVYQKDNYNNKEISVKVTVIDEGVSELAKLEYAWVNDNPIIPTVWKEFDQNEFIKDMFTTGRFYLWIRATDNAGNITSKVSEAFIVRGWQLQNEQDWYFFDENGNKLFGWQELHGRPDDATLYKYYLDPNTDGKATIGWKTIDSKIYYFNEGNDAPGGKGSLVTGWKLINNKYYYFSISGEMQTGWLDLPPNKYYLNSNGEMQTGLIEISGELYYFNEDGEMQTGWINIGDKRYYFNTNGKAQIGWKTINGYRYHFNENGEMETGWVFYDGVNYYLYPVDNSEGGIGAAAIGWKEIDNRRYYFQSGGEMTISWLEIDGKWYHFKTSGEMSVGWEHLGPDWYYFDKTGIMQTGWIEIEGKWYYFNEDGIMQTGWLNLEERWYYLNEDGQMQTGLVTVDDDVYYLNADGVMLTGWQEVNQKWYYFNTDGKAQTGWKTINGYRYHFNENGVMETGWVSYDGVKYYLSTTDNTEGGIGAAVTGWKVIDSKKYYFQSGGEMTISWLEIGGKWYHFNNSGEMSVGWLELEGKYYYFNEDGIMQTGWLENPTGVWYYLGTNGEMQTGWVQVDGYWYLLDTNGKMLTDWQQNDGYWYYLGSNGKMQTDWIFINGYWYYLKPDGFSGWSGPTGSMISNATVTINGKSYSFDDNGHCLNP